MANERRMELQMKLEELLGNRNVYYQPPEDLKMSYPAIRYSVKNRTIKFANNSLYTKMLCYEITVIARDPDTTVIDKLLQFPYCAFDRHYNSDNLSHDVFTLYF
jgi:hypothetical protein